MEEFIIRSIGGTLTQQVSGATAKLDFLIAGGSSRFARQGVLLTNTGASSIFVKLAQINGAAPPVTATNYHYQITPGQTVAIKIGRTIDVYVFGTGALYEAIEIA